MRSPHNPTMIENRSEIERLVRRFSPSERVIWRSLKGPVPIGLRRAFMETAKSEAWDEKGLNRKAG